MASEDVQTNLRLPADLKDRLQASATQNKRSLSAEVAARLEDSFNGSNVSLPYPAMGAVQKLAEAEDISEADAIEKLVLQGHSSLSKRTVLVVHGNADASIDDLVNTIKSAKLYVPEIDEVHFERASEDESQT